MLEPLNLGVLEKSQESITWCFWDKSFCYLFLYCWSICWKEIEAAQYEKWIYRESRIIMPPTDLFILFSYTLVKKVEIQLQTVELSIAKLIMQKFLYQSYLHWEGDFMVKSISSKVGVLPRSSESLKVPLPLQHMQRESRWADHWCSPMSDRYFT